MPSRRMDTHLALQAPRCADVTEQWQNSPWFGKGSLALSHVTPVHHGQDRPLWSIHAELSRGFPAAVSDLLRMLIFFAPLVY
jgi:hypothetical protein